MEEINEEKSLTLVRSWIDYYGVPLEKAIENPLIPEAYRDKILRTLKEEENTFLEPANIIRDEESDEEAWLTKEDRPLWYYWPTLREYLIHKKGWSKSSIQSLDSETDRILGLLSSPKKEFFDKKGLVLGFVQSGKTSNYTALIAKAADTGYKLIIVLSGIDNGLRLQTHRRLENELVGCNEGGTGVKIPPSGKRWVEFTKAELNGDFQAGFVNTAALQGSQPPVLMVIKKNGAVLRRLISWLNSAPEDIKKMLPVLVIDDESDLASIDTKGSYKPDIEEENISLEEYEDPSMINSLIRDLLNHFNRKSYVAYTATPFANILIPHDNYDPRFSDDLYPKNFIINLPKPHKYFGAEELFGAQDYYSESEDEGIDVIRTKTVESQDLFLKNSIVPQSMKNAILSFVLAGAVRSYRNNKKDFPATMLIHVTLRTINQEKLKEMVETTFTTFRDEWRYDRKKGKGVYKTLLQLWEEDFSPLIQKRNPDKKEITFKELEKHISIFFESVSIRTLNSISGDSQTLDYEKEPNLKLIAIGGNKLSRGLTLEGLLISYFTRRTKYYDTLLQMGRWFGFREGYEDLTRIYTTPEIAGWFSHLAQIESELRQEIKIYEEQKLTPFQVGLKIKCHPIMQVTNRSKMRYASELISLGDLSGRRPQTIKFPLKNLELLSKQEDNNLFSTREFLSKLGNITAQEGGVIYWKDIPAKEIINFLNNFQVDESSDILKIPLVTDYITRSNEKRNLINWTVAICSKKNPDENWGDVDWGLNIKINQISRNQERDNENSLKNITNSRDELIGLTSEEKEKVEIYASEHGLTPSHAARYVRNPSEGLLLLYPISKYSKPIRDNPRRVPLYENPEDPFARNLIGLAISFPYNPNPSLKDSTKKYIYGTVPPRSFKDESQ